MGIIKDREERDVQQTYRSDVLIREISEGISLIVILHHKLIQCKGISFGFRRYLLNLPSDATMKFKTRCD